MRLSFSSLVNAVFLLFGILLIQLEASQSADYWNYYDRFSDRNALQIETLSDLIGLIWSSQVFYLALGPFFDLSPILPYHVTWLILWFGLCSYGFRPLHWILFFSFFPGPDLVINLIRQEAALGVFALLISVRMPALAVGSFFFHPSSLLTFGFYYFSKIFEDFFIGSRLRSILLSLAVFAIIGFLLNSSLFVTGLAKLDAKRGLAEFGSHFIFFVYIQITILAVLCLSIRSPAKRFLFTATAIGCLAITVFEIYFYRFIYIVYPFIIYEIAESFRLSAINRRISTWILGSIRYSLVLISGVFVMYAFLL